jgi:prevent-host-death family protein
MHIQAGEFKAKCLKIMDQVARTGVPVTVTKHGREIVQLFPVAASKHPFVGRLSGTATFIGDIVSPVDENWEADAG